MGVRALHRFHPADMARSASFRCRWHLLWGAAGAHLAHPSPKPAKRVKGSRMTALRADLFTPAGQLEAAPVRRTGRVGRYSAL